VGWPAWGRGSAARRAHVERVAALLAQWAEAMGVAAGERERWLRAAYLHDALREGPHPNRLAHGPAAATRAAAEGEADAGVLDAVRYHTTGYAGWDDVGRMLYLADYLEPGRNLAPDELAWADRVPRERDAVLRDVARRRVGRVLAAGWPLPPETVAFWNALTSR
jgi:HD superfamily phosphohydrolase YqeK